MRPFDQGALYQSFREPEVLCTVRHIRYGRMRWSNQPPANKGRFTFHDRPRAKSSAARHLFLLTLNPDTNSNSNKHEVAELVFFRSPLRTSSQNGFTRTALFCGEYRRPVHTEDPRHWKCES